MKVIGLTGGIGMGKSTAAAAFRRAGLPVFDADAAVHRLQARGGRAVPAIARAFPGAMRDGAVDRAALRQAVVFDPAAMRRLEAILHPMVRAEERAFLGRARRAGVAAGLAVTSAGRPLERTWVASTDADSVVPAHWLTSQLAAADAGADLVLGTVRPDPADAPTGVDLGFPRNH